MRQLKMYFVKGTPVPEFLLPEGYSFSLYKDENDIQPWLECCKQGLVPDDADESNFRSHIFEHDFVDPYSDLLFLDYNGEHIGTVTAVYHSDKNIGEVHMVGIRPDWRGKGLAKHLNNKAIQVLSEKNVDYIYLTTDEWRKGAVKSYLDAGFVPVDYSVGMTQRWQSMLARYGIDSVDMVDEDGKFLKKLHRMGWDKDERKVRIGVVGAGRGENMMSYCKNAKNAKLVAICDSYQFALDKVKAEFGDEVAYYSDFDEFLTHDMDAVVLANYANEHAPLAIKCMEHGLNVLSEVLPVQTMQEAVELTECVERTGMLYAYAENCCFMGAPRKMRQLYRSGKLGEFEYGEGEYFHNCESGWDILTKGDPNHWRNNMFATFYCTHSIGPLIHISGLRPVSVTGFELPFNERMARMGAKAGHSGIEMITLENGAVIKSAHGVGCSGMSLWFSVSGSNGNAESARELAVEREANTHLNYKYTEPDGNEVKFSGIPTDEITELAEGATHGGSDFYVMHFFCEKLLGEADAETIDIYEAMDMFLPGLLAYRSVLNGGAPMQIPDFRDPKQREPFRNDTACTDPNVAGEQYIPSYSKGNPDVPQSVYDGWAKKYKEKYIDKKN